MKQSFRSLLFQGFLFILLFQLLHLTTAAQTPPNVLLILTDDQGWGDLHCHGNDSLSTPNLDALASESVEFDRFYVDPAGASTRASLLTGRYALRAGVSGEAYRREVMRAGEVTMAEVFRGTGYRTALFGKWDNGAQYPNDPTGQGFDEFFGFFGNDTDPPAMHNRDTVGTAEISPDLLTDKAIGYMSADPQRPFFCMIAYDSPRNPCHSPAFYAEKYKKAGLSDQNAVTYGAIENIDDNVGRLLQALDSLGIRDNTWVVFVSDGGPDGVRYNAGLRGQKGSFYEGGIRVPCFIHRRNYLAPRHLPGPAAHIDLLPTITGLCEFPLPDGIQPDGVNFSRIMQGAPDLPGDRMLFFHLSREKISPYPGAIRAGRFAFILNEQGVPELYNLRNDRAQTFNLADSLPEITSILKNKYPDWYADVTRAGIEPAPVPLNGRNGAMTWLPVSDRDTAESRRPTDNIPDPNLVREDVWLNERDSVIWWSIDVPEQGTYDFFVEYACDSAFAGGMLVLVTDGSETKITVAEPSQNNRPLPPDRVPCKEAKEKDWKSASAGMEVLNRGVQRIRLYLPYFKKGWVEVKGLVLKKLGAGN